MPKQPVHFPILPHFSLATSLNNLALLYERNYPGLTQADIQACLSYASETLKAEKV
ncbi:hypothetical protein [Trichothermofontia sp.]